MPPPNPLHHRTSSTNQPPFRPRRFLFLLLPLLLSLLLLLQNFHRAFLSLTTSRPPHPSKEISRIGVGKDTALNRLMGLAPPVVNRDEARNGGNGISYYGVNVVDLEEGGVGDMDLGMRVGIGDGVPVGLGDRSHVYDAFDDDGDDDDYGENMNDDDTDVSMPTARKNEFMPLEHDVSANGTETNEIPDFEESEVEFNNKTGENMIDEENESDENEAEESNRSDLTPSEFYSQLKRRVIQKRKGRRWGGWYNHSTGKNTSDGVDSDDHNDANDDLMAGDNSSEKEEYEIIGDIEHWWRNSRSCFEVDRLCHLKQTADWESVRDWEGEEIEKYMAGLHKWFYYDDRISKHESGDEEKRQLFQPSMTLKFQPYKYDKGTHAETRVSIEVKSPSSLELDDGDADVSIPADETTFDPSKFNVLGNDSFSFGENADVKLRNTICRVSPTPTHIVVQSVFNDMIGEFYARTLMKLYQLMSKTADAAKGAKIDIASSGVAEKKQVVPPWEQDIQFYVHLAFSNKKMLDAHKLLLSSLLTSPESKDVKSFLELFEEKERDQSLTKNDAECQCYEKMVFCGYDVYTQDGDDDSSDDGDDNDDENEAKSSREDEIDENLELSSVDDDESKTDDGIEAGDEDNEEDEDEEDNVELNDSHFDNSDDPDSNDEKLLGEAAFNSETPPIENVKYTLWSGGAIDAGPERRECALPTKVGQCQDWGRLRDFLLSNIIRHYPSIEDDFVSHRRKALIGKGFVDESYQGDTKEWKIVGLTQRTYRRTWLNLSEVIDACDELHIVSQHKVACIEVNVEKTKSPLEQLLLHGNLDGLIGVHGAQMTQAILLPRNAHVLELLPWIPNYTRGLWVQRRSSPTPLGIIFHNTDLNHLGYSLGRDSVPLCKGVKEEEEQQCFLNRRNGNKVKFVWESRNFNVKPKPIVQYIENVVLQSGSNGPTASCEQMKARLDKEFVWYNIWCRDDASVDGSNQQRLPPSAKHFYEDGINVRETRKKRRKRRHKSREIDKIIDR